ncbi:MAG: 2-oxo-4-hydroxy-4-carboxy-5-ureidoimidazoline decarboxylase [Streptosporangiaceae bacterium]|nr:2-oxo-4-hydroxy-4-carboxy-5-ureidoimidazoline decarboxylase [Streptosporangiaceae bacterium]
MRRGAVEDFNAAAARDAERDVLACCASPQFAKAMVAGRPYREAAELQAAIGTAFAALSWDDVAEAIRAHPRIGERPPAGGRAAAEQSGAAHASDQVRRDLAAGNLAYEERFGHVFLICATGLSGQDMLDQLQARLGNDVQAERAVVRRELLKITRLRMKKLLGL